MPFKVVDSKTCTLITVKIHKIIWKWHGKPMKLKFYMHWFREKTDIMWKSHWLLLEVTGTLLLDPFYACVCVCARESLSRVQFFAIPWTLRQPGSPLCGILQARTLQWVAIPFSRGSSWPRDRTWVSCIAGRFITILATRESCLYVCVHVSLFL